MNLLSVFIRLSWAVVFFTAGLVLAAPPEIPEPLQPWEDWATWDVKHRDCPTPYFSAESHLCFWPTVLAVQANANEGSWSLDVTAYDEIWVPLPGNSEMWPLAVQVDGVEGVVVERDGVPSVRVAPGAHRLAGIFAWEEIPQRILIPKSIGLLTLGLDGRPVPIPNWDASGHLWLKRQRAEATDKDQIAVQVYRLIEDGIPVWLHTEIELSVSGKSREEDLGWVLPAGWKLAVVDSPIPVAVDEDGQLKAQVRAGKWTVALQAFRTSDPGEITYAATATPIIDRELVAFQAQPAFRMAEVEGLRAVDVTQTTFPGKWRTFPVFEWMTDTSFRLVEKMRGMGLQQPEGVTINREFWLDEDGAGITFRDAIQGRMQQKWRLDIAEGLELGAVRMDGKGQLITTNPQTGAHGVELRTRMLDLEAVGRMDRVTNLPATGWQTDVDGLNVKINLPPGWRVFALFGADWVRGDWLTAWSLLDLFLLLIFAMAVFRMWGWKAGVVAFFAFGLAYHEPGSPRFTWLFLLMPLALLRVVTAGRGRKYVLGWRNLAVALLVLWLVPFVAMQVQSVIYPQLESRGETYRERRGSIRNVFTGMGASLGGADAQTRPRSTQSMATFDAEEAPMQKGEVRRGRASLYMSSNLAYDPKAKIQTGPAEPEWTWNRVQCGWNGPVSSEQQIHPVLLSLRAHRALTLVRVLLLLMLAGILLRVRRLAHPLGANGSTAVALIALMMWGMPGETLAELPDAQMLQTLQNRLLESSDAYPHGAVIPEASLTVTEDRISMEAEIHCAVWGAVPLPGRLPSWSPVSVTIDGQSAAVLRRQDGYLWVVLGQGVHRVQVDGLLPGSTEWAWTFQLPPKRVTVDAPGWTVTGIRPNGVPDEQIFLARQIERTEAEAAYDRKDFNVILAVDRYIEVGLIWQVHTEVTRLSSPGRAVSVQVPLLPGEKVLTANRVVEAGAIEVQLGAGVENFSWDSELPVGDAIALVAEETDRWIERWHLVTSPVWNVELSGVAPVFETSEKNLVPVWHPWPGESVGLSFRKPEAVIGETMTVRRVRHDISLGQRQRTVRLTVEVEASIGDDFLVTLDPKAEITSLKQDGATLPVRRDGAQLIIPVHPGKQNLEVEWKTDQALATRVQADALTLPVEAANITTALRMPDSRWVLWADGPQRGPAVRFWTILAVALIAAWVLGSLRLSPIGHVSWMLLALGLTQVHVLPALLVVSWFFLLAWRGKHPPDAVHWLRFDLRQISVVLHSATALVILVAAVGQGLLGNPEMFISGQGSSRRILQWFLPTAGTELPQPAVISVSVWFYRLLMLAWALWLATALLGWLKWGWTQFSEGGCWKSRPRKSKKGPPILPTPQG